MATLYLRNGIYYIQYYYDSRRVQRSLNTRDEQAALDELEKQKARLVLDLEQSHPETITTAKFIKIYQDRTKPYITTATYKYDQYNLNRYKKQFPGLLKNISPKQLEHYINSRKRKCQIPTLNREIGFLKAFFSRAVDWGYLKDNPADKLKAFKLKRRIPRFFTAAEVDLLLHKAKKISSYLHLIILTGVETGLRKSELVHLTWKDINFDNDSIIVQAKDNWQPKDYEIRSIPISAQLALDLRRHKLQQKGLTKWVFPTIYGTRRSNNLGRDFRKLLGKVKLYERGVGWHTLRHTFASHLVMQGAPLKTVAELLGHSNTKMTEIYSHLAPDHLRDSIARLPFGRNLRK